MKMNKSRKEKPIDENRLSRPEYIEIDPDECEFFDQRCGEDIDEEFDDVFPAVDSHRLVARRAIEARLEEIALRVSLEDFPE